MTDTISKERVIENAQNIYDMFVSNYGFSSVLALDMKTVLDSLRAALAQQAEQEWRPIASAPKDEIILLGLPLIGNIREDDRRVYEGRWNEVQATWTSVNGFLLLGAASHWMSLPAAPKGGV